MLVKSTPFEDNDQKGKRRRLIALGGASILLVGGMLAIFQWTSQTPSPKTTTEVNSIEVKTLTVEPETGYTVTRRYTGEISARRSSELGLERGGELTAVLVTEGDRVFKGQPLAQLDTRNLQAQQKQLEARREGALAQLEQLQTGPRPEAISAAKARVRNLEKELELKEIQRSRREFLYQEGAISQEQRDEFVTQEESLTARLNEAESQLEELLNGTRKEEIAAQQATVQELEARIEDIEVTLSKSVLKAPFDGIVSKRYIDEGTVIQTGEAVIRLVENAVPEARIGVPTAMTDELPLGSSHTVTIDSREFTASVTAIVPEIDPETRTQEVILELDRSAITQTYPGQTVRLTRNQTIETEGYWLPLSALTKGVRGLWTAYVVVESFDEKGWEVQQQAVEILHQNADRAYIRGTLQPNDQIVASGTHRLVPGQNVSVINQSPLTFQKGNK
jgi:multidrug efflux pump subunit AcrA (membrane-fusion protein)